MKKIIKWEDPEDNKNFENEEVENIHKKIYLKKQNISEGLKDFHSEITNNITPLWVKNKKQLPTSSIGKLSKNAETFQKDKKTAVSISKILQTDNRDSLNSVVQALDTNIQKNLVLYAGFDKILKIIKLNKDDKKNYQVENSVYFENLPILNAKFIFNPSKICLSYLKKSFFSIYDLEKAKSSSIYKLFNVKNNVEKCELNNNRSLALITAQNNLTLYDLTKNFVIERNIQPAKIIDCCFIDENKFLLNYNDFNVKVFDIRKSLKIPLQQKKINVHKIKGNNDYLIFGHKNGMVELYDTDLNLIKKFPQLTTEISNLDINDDFFTFSSKWKKNSIRICDLKTKTLLPSWPNIKTRLDFVTQIQLDDNNQLIAGNSKGKISVYSIN